MLGATWAASEIILGSFLHNLHVPLKGNILTAIALILFITASYKWKNKGLFWRSGLICAIMKTISPSAVIFGPMIAIVAEAVLFNSAVRLFGRNTVGFIVGAILAMSWVLLQKVVNLLLFYGLNIVKIYDNLLIFIQKQLNIKSDIFWIPLLVLLFTYAIFGVVSVIVGIRIGKNILKSGDSSDFSTKNIEEQQNNEKASFPHSILWLVLSFGALVFSLILLSNSSVFIWLPWSILILLLWIMRYKRGMRQLSRPKFWISFVIITLLAALLFQVLNGSENNWTDGLLLGLEMNVRAAIVIVGFSVLGTELYNPVIRDFMSRSAYRQVGMAVELAFNTLPSVVSILPDARVFFTQPGRVIRTLIQYAEHRLNELNAVDSAKVIIVTGKREEGKTTFLKQLSGELKKANWLLSGFISPRIKNGSVTTGYILEDVKTGKRTEFLSLNEETNVEPGTIGKFRMNNTGLSFGKHLLSDDELQHTGIVIIDEIGRLELAGEGWNDDVLRLINKPDLFLIVAVRDKFVSGVIQQYNLKNVQVLNVNLYTPTDLLKMIFAWENKIRKQA